jgi:quercetin dioxygenase-like cupin family protein
MTLYKEMAMPHHDKDSMISHSKTLELSSLTAYQEGAIVSRIILEKPAGSVTIFSFDKEQGLSEHTAPFDALVQVIEGQAEIIIAGTPYPVSAGEVILMPASVPHAVRAPERFKILLTMLKA